MTSLVALHPSGGRAIKQWDLDRFADAGSRIARERGAALVLTGSPGDRRDHGAGACGACQGTCRSSISPARPRSSRSAAVLARCALLVTGDTGPMHLAAACGTPVVAIFGPSDPARYAPRDDRASCRADRSAVRAVQPHPAAAGAVPGAHARLSGRGRGGHGRRGGARPAAHRGRRVTTRLVRIERAGRQDTIDLDELTRLATPRSARNRAQRVDQGDFGTRRSTASPLRERFTYRGDSLWWFAELFLHKRGRHRGALADGARARCAHRARAAATRSAPRPATRRWRTLVPQAARRHGVRLLRDRRSSRSADARRGPAQPGADVDRARLTMAPRAPAHHASTRAVRSRSSTRRSGGLRHRRRTCRRGGGLDGRRGLHRGGAERAGGLVAGGRAPGRRGTPHKLPRPALVASPSFPGAAPLRTAAPSSRSSGSPAGASLRTPIASGARATATARALLDSEDVRARTRVDGYDVWPLVARELRRDRRAAVPVVGARHGRSRRRARRGCSRRRSSRTRRREAGAAPSCSRPGGEASRRRRPAAWVHLPSLAQLSPRSRRDGGLAGEPAGSRLSAADLTLRLRRVCRGASRGRRALSGRRGRGSPEARRLDRLGAALAAVAAGDRDASRRAWAWPMPTRVALVVSKRTQIGRGLAALSRPPDATPGLRLVDQAASGGDRCALCGGAGGASAVRDRRPAALDLARLLAVAPRGRHRQFDGRHRRHGARHSRARRRAAEQPEPVRRAAGHGRRGRRRQADWRGMAAASTLELSRLAGDEESAPACSSRPRSFAAEYGVKPDWPERPARGRRDRRSWPPASPRLLSGG